ncbi:conserved hypothetical protein [Arthrobacter sp. 9AX]|nr:conserved hypothetical protein [Arthrobacter sp. 9AX]
MGLKPLTLLWIAKTGKILIPIHTLFKTCSTHSP